ncbi:MAG TPA: NYN domain-containing protein [Thalassobaculum sp.]
MSNQDLDYKLAVFCDFENIALGVRDAKIARFDMNLVTERLLLKGSIVVKKAYCDWDRYKEFKTAMHEAAFEMIEIPHTRQSGKNSADIRMVVDALDLCYTKEHIDTFVIVSGDSDFSPLVSKLRENAKTVVGVGVRNSTSDLLMKNCDEFIFYDDLARALAPRDKAPAKKKVAVADKTVADKTVADKAGADKAAPDKKPAAAPVVVAKPAAAAGDDNGKGTDRIAEAVGLVQETAEALIAERGDPVWGSMVKQTLRRRHPGFSEGSYGFRSFSDLLEEAEDRGVLDLEWDERSGGYMIRAAGRGG